MNNILKALFENVFWPAVAGNVFWALCNLVIDPDSSWIEVAPRVVVLLFLSIYLSIGWLRVRRGPEEFPLEFWPFEFLHLWAIVFAALAAHLNPGLLEFLLYVYFSVTTAGHAFGAFRQPDDEKNLHYRLVGINAIGAGIIVGGGYFGLADWIRLPGSFAVAFLLWLRFGRAKELSEIEKRLGPPAWARDIEELKERIPDRLKERIETIERKQPR